MAKKEKAPVFTKAELLDAYHVFGVSREFLAGALHGVEEATKEQAEKLVGDFKKPKKGE